MFGGLICPAVKVYEWTGETLMSTSCCLSWCRPSGSQPNVPCCYRQSTCCPLWGYSFWKSILFLRVVYVLIIKNYLEIPMNISRIVWCRYFFLEYIIAQALVFLLCDAMQAWSMPSCSVCPSVTYVDYVNTSNHIFKKNFYPRVAKSFLFFRTKLYGNILMGPANGGVELRWVMQKTQFSMKGWLSIDWWSASNNCDHPPCSLPHTLPSITESLSTSMDDHDDRTEFICMLQ